jgi:FeS assembly SUF system regulator
MIKLSKLTDYGVVLLSYMVQNPHVTALNAAALSLATHVPEPTVAKVMKALAKANVVESHRGALGGYSLAQLPQTITMRQIIEAIDGPIAVTACTSHAHCGPRSQADLTATCALSCVCPLKGHWQKVNNTIITALDQLTLLDVMDS